MRAVCQQWAGGLLALGMAWSTQPGVKQARQLAGVLLRTLASEQARMLCHPTGCKLCLAWLQQSGDGLRDLTGSVCGFATKLPCAMFVSHSCCFAVEPCGASVLSQGSLFAVAVHAYADLLTYPKLVPIQRCVVIS